MLTGTRPVCCGYIFHSSFVIFSFTEYSARREAGFFYSLNRHHLPRPESRTRAFGFRTIIGVDFGCLVEDILSFREEVSPVCTSSRSKFFLTKKLVK